jgi:hypothetical protein
LGDVGERRAPEEGLCSGAIDMFKKIREDDGLGC